MYPNPMLRNPGDIDLFLVPKTYASIQERRKKVTAYVHKRFPQSRIRYHHIDYPIFDDVEVEVHYVPTLQNNPVYNRRIQQWVEGQIRLGAWKKEAMLPGHEEMINVPSTEFNKLYYKNQDIWAGLAVSIIKKEL